MKKVKCQNCGFIHDVNWNLVDNEPFDYIGIEEEDWYCPECSREYGAVRVKVIEVEVDKQ
jgi:rubredoxin